MNAFISMLAEEDSLGACLSQTGPPGLGVHDSAASSRSGGPRIHGSKVVHDRIHDQMLFHGALVAIIDTPEFQRLRDLHQLGNVRYLFSGAVNTRFEHSLGVAHLALKLLRMIKTTHLETPGLFDLDITPTDELCVAIAGLCHDLGHGPMSHMFEGFVNDMRRERDGDKAEKWHHEDASIAMFDHLLKVNDIDLTAYSPPLQQTDVTFIKQLINGLKPGAPWPPGNGRDANKRFMFDIVCNKRNGIDVDKLDYFLRDSMSCYGKLPDIHVERILTCARVVMDREGESQIAFEEKVALSLSELFTLRAKMHKFVYQHRVVKIIDEMTKEALASAERGGFTIQAPPHPKLLAAAAAASSAAGGEGSSIDAQARDAISRPFRLSESVTNMFVYAVTGDWLLNAIAASSTPELEEARGILRRIRSRQHYKLVGYCNMTRIVDASLKRGWKALMANQILERVRQDEELGADGDGGHSALGGGDSHILSPTTTMQPAPTIIADDEDGEDGDGTNQLPPMPLSNIVIVDAHIVFGSSGEDGPGDPISNVRFFNPKRNLNVAFKLSDNRISPLFSPREFEEWTAFVYSRDEKYAERLSAAFHKWKIVAINAGRASEPVAFVNSSPSPIGGQRKAKRFEAGSPSGTVTPSKIPCTPPPPPRFREL